MQSATIHSHDLPFSSFHHTTTTVHNNASNLFTEKFMTFITRLLTYITVLILGFVPHKAPTFSHITENQEVKGSSIHVSIAPSFTITPIATASPTVSGNRYHRNHEPVIDCIGPD